MIIPIFIPFGGCDFKCVFCDQAGITGEGVLPDQAAVVATINEYLSTWKGGGESEVAFYGGSFTGLSENDQRGYLEAVDNFIRDGRISSVRISTRPDYIDRDKVVFLKDNHVRTVELGVQSMDDEVLRLSGRGHSVESTREAFKVLKGFGMKVGAQVMPGLPGDTVETILMTMREVVRLEPDFVRIYPVLVMKDTPLYTMYESGNYEPWELSRMVSILREALAIFERASITVIKVGLHPTESLKENIVAGPFHPSIRQLACKEPVVNY